MSCEEMLPESNILDLVTTDVTSCAGIVDEYAQSCWRNLLLVPELFHFGCSEDRSEKNVLVSLAARERSLILSRMVSKT